jgi:hypothetical protein
MSDARSMNEQSRPQPRISAHRGRDQNARDNRVGDGLRALDLRRSSSQVAARASDR